MAAWWRSIAVPAVVTFLLGYFIGREHVKYELRAAFSNMAEAFSEGFGDRDDETVSSSSTADRSPAAEPSRQLAAQLMLGQTYQSDEFEITLTKATIGPTRVRDLMDQIKVGTTPVLSVVFSITNIDNRRILRFRKGNRSMSGHFQLRDDVSNRIRGVSYGFGSEPIGALTGSEDITPGATVTHLEVFAVPPPKTEFLLLTVDLACLGGEGTVEYKIPASNIAR